MDEATYVKRLEAEGYKDIGVIEWEAGRVNDTHTHDFTARAYVLQGALTVDCDSESTTCNAGDDFTLAAGISHVERVGPDGVKFVFGKK